MSSEGPSGSSAFRVALLAILTAVVTVFTIVIRIPSPVPGGYAHLGDVAIVFVALTFGGFSGAVTAGFGTAIGDLIAYPAFAPMSLLVHGLEGLAAGLIGRWVQDRPGQTAVRMVLAGLAAVIVTTGGYFLGETIFIGVGPAVEEIPLNLAQSGAGAVIGPLLSLAVRKAYPPVDTYRW